jgi:hypothetical protein
VEAKSHIRCSVSDLEKQLTVIAVWIKRCIYFSKLPDQLVGFQTAYRKVVEVKVCADKSANKSDAAT